jgi:hypothetical protein
MVKAVRVCCLCSAEKILHSTCHTACFCEKICSLLPVNKSLLPSVKYPSRFIGS